MKDLKEFLDQFVKVEFHEHEKSFGFYPFQMFVEDKEGKDNVICLDLGGEIGKVYQVFAEYYKQEPKRIYLAVDFPANHAIKNDFIFVVAYENKIFEVLAMPYRVKTGKMLSQIKHSRMLTKIFDDLCLFINPKP